VSKALYRKYRSKTLDEVIGQRHITDILSRAISEGHISHAYLLTGPRGVGKTSVARIMAYEINGLPYDEDNTNLDIIEIDAFHASKKVYIIDEVHMLSKAAFNALLKTLEEPPEHVIFILATTNIEKLPATIISRAQRFSFRPISIDDAVKHLSYIAKEEGIKIEDDAIKLIAERSDGSFRDSISLLDQLSSLVNTNKDKITVKLIEDMLGLAPNEVINQLLNAVEDKDLKNLVGILDRTFSEGVDGAVLISQLTSRIRQQLPEKPHLLPLLDTLIDVTKSPQPQLKLLSVLGMASIPKNPPKTIALATPVREVSASIEELEKRAVQDTSLNNNKGELDWSKLINFTRKNYIALFSVLSKCGYVLDGDTLTLYTANKFYKNKLDDSKYSSLLSKCLQETGVFGLNVHTIPTTLPPKDSKAAAVAVIMGGGEEVSIESV
jgi:DNA polymerase-3 subunit gamma/tau